MYKNIKAKCTSTEVMDRLYTETNMHFGLGGAPRINYRKPIYEIPDTCITDEDVRAFIDAYTFGIVLHSKDNKYNHETSAHMLHSLYSSDLADITKCVVEAAILDQEHNHLKDDQASKLMKSIAHAVGYTDGREKAIRSFIDEGADRMCYEENDQTFAYIMFHSFYRDSGMGGIQAISAYQTVGDPSNVYEGYTVTSKVFEIAPAEVITSENRLEGSSNYFETTVYGKRCVNQSWNCDIDMSVWPAMMGCLCAACRDAVKEYNHAHKDIKACFFGNEFIKPSCYFMYDRGRMNLLCRWLFDEKQRCKVLSHRCLTKN